MRRTVVAATAGPGTMSFQRNGFYLHRVHLMLGMALLVSKLDLAHVLILIMGVMTFREQVSRLAAFVGKEQDGLWEVGFSVKSENHVSNKK